MAIKIKFTHIDDGVLEAHYDADADIPLVHMMNAIDNCRIGLMNAYIDLLISKGHKEYLTREEINAEISKYTISDLQFKTEHDGQKE